MSEFLHSLQIAAAVLTAAATALLGYMFYNSSLTNRQPFTTRFLKFLSLCSALNAVEIACAVYRTSRIAPGSIPMDATGAGLIGRCFELTGYILMILFLLRPETKRALNGSEPQLIVMSGELPPDFWRKEIRVALRDEMKPEYLKERDV